MHAGSSLTPSPSDPRGRVRATERARAAADGVARFGAVLVVLVALFIYLSVSQANFLTRLNVEDLLTGASLLWLVSLGMTLVVITAGIDLSVGSMLALTGIFLAKMLNLGVPSLVTVFLCIAFGAFVGGALNGFLIGRVGLSFFVVTLASMIGLTGVVNLWSNGQTFTISSRVVADIGVGSLAGIPAPIWIMVGSFAVALYVQRSTAFGRNIYAVGGNLDAARLSGIRVPRTIIAVYAISGACAAVAGVIECGRLGAASPAVGTNIALSAAAAVLLGGTSFSGGVGGVGGTAVGVLFIGTVQNGLSIAAVSGFWQEVVTGVILVVAVLVDKLRQNAAGRRARPTGPGAGEPRAAVDGARA
jgi:ribose transport system permease protein